MTSMDQIVTIRALYFEQGKNISEIATETGLNWKTVQKYVDQTDFNPPAPKPPEQKTICPKLDPYKPIIDQWLMDDKKAPRKQRHTANRVYERLCEEVDGFNCSYRLVAEYVSAKKVELNLNKRMWDTPRLFIILAKPSVTLETPPSLKTAERLKENTLFCPSRTVTRVITS